MSIYEYDEEKHMKQVFEEGQELGVKQGRELEFSRMSKLIEILLKENLQDDLLRITKDPGYQQELCQKYHIE